ncbi:SDR family oxidoreductase [Streptomyces sp. TRM 70361]|uniref:SDR family NAD(P)-dependent oxidoreductase n=1 Tax=Streptomyces sp. TRM 70361 TaxID=3116553 RepID=UPI002E7AF9AA|nr:SDR family oxidoreductase [Streptomyces sp. TRM 70361]MEE1938079.1 SDR family oxidoreductase [Streptomyces sp. TRM 70361]
MNAVDYRGQTTLITGASAGLGVEFARRLAERGSDLVLVARRADRLEKLAAELTAAHGIRATALPMDLAAEGAGRRLADETAARGLDVTSLVNNAGFGTHGRFHQIDPGRLSREVALDVGAVVDISRVFIEQLRVHGRGVLVNVASTAAYQSTPNLAVYGAAKAFVLHFTEALWQESRGSGLRVLALSPGATRTEFFDVAGSEAAAGGSPLRPPADVVRTALRTLDRRNPPPSVIAGRMNRTMIFASRFLGRRLALRVVDRMTTHSEPAGAAAR